MFSKPAASLSQTKDSSADTLRFGLAETPYRMKEARPERIAVAREVLIGAPSAGRRTSPGI
jgi:hypothetical protein